MIPSLAWLLSASWLDTGKVSGQLGLAQVLVDRSSADAVAAGEDGFRDSIRCPLDQLGRPLRCEGLFVDAHLPNPLTSHQSLHPSPVRLSSMALIGAGHDIWIV